MSVEAVDQLIRKYLSTGVAVVVVLVAPATTDGAERPERPAIVVVDPTAPSDGDPNAGTPDAGSGSRGDPARGDNTENDGEDDATAGGDADPGRRDSVNGSADGDPAGEEDTDEDRTPDGSAARDSDTGESMGSDDAATPTPAAGVDGRARSDSNRSDSNRSDSNRSDSGRSDSERTGAAGTDPDHAPADRTETTRPSGDTPSPDRTTTAAERHGWGTPNREDTFTDGPDGWNVYDGPGHAGEGTRSPSAVSLDGGMLTITGDPSGTTAGMAWGAGQKYGRWEGRVRAPAGDESYNALLLLWPDAEDFPVGGEIDFMEMTDASRQQTDLFLHHGADNSQVHGEVEIDATEWHNWALEWTPTAITAYVDGEEWFRTTDTDVFPPGPMHLCIQLDWFPEGGDVRESRMEVDWVRQYSLNDEGGSSGGGS